MPPSYGMTAPNRLGFLLAPGRTSMRNVAFAGAAAFAMLALLPAVQAQDECSQAAPCPLVVEVGPNGFVDISSWNRSAGDFVTYEVDNSDAVPHTVTLEGYDITFIVPASDSREQVVQLSKTGTFKITDTPSQDTATLTVVNGDSVDYEQSGSTTGKGLPGLGLPELTLALVGLALLARRR